MCHWLFQEYGWCHKPEQSRDPILFVRTPENTQHVTEFFEDDYCNSICQATRELKLSFLAILAILRKDLKWKPYRFKHMQKLSTWSPDLDPLIFFWGYEMAEVFGQKPSTIEDLKEIIKKLARQLLGQVICGVMANFQCPCQACWEASG